VNDQTISSTKPSVIITAYNEATVIRTTLQLLASEQGTRDYQIIVICNGCTDDTEKIVRCEFKDVHCYSLSQASKALAIRYAESLNPGFPRLYLDADIECEQTQVEKLVELGREHDEPRLIIPGSKLITQHSSGLVKSFYRVWYNTEHVRLAGYGAGAYLVNKLARERFGIWPELIADDGFVRSQFTPNEILIAHTCNVTVKAPKKLSTLIRVKARSKFGNLELENYLEQLKQKQSSITKTMLPVIEHLKWYDKAVYYGVNLMALVIAKCEYRAGKKRWYRDDSNR